MVYDGAINDGSGQSVEVTGRDGGGVTFSGNISDCGDAGGGIVVSGNSDGSTTFSGASKVLNTGASNAVALSSNGSPVDGHEVQFTNGGLDIDASSGQGLTSSNFGRLTVGGTGNSINTGTGVGLNVDTTRIMPGDLNFDSDLGQRGHAGDPAQRDRHRRAVERHRYRRRLCHHGRPVHRRHHPDARPRTRCH